MPGFVGSTATGHTTPDHKNIGIDEYSFSIRKQAH